MSEMQEPGKGPADSKHAERATSAGGVGTLECPALVFPGQGSQFVGMGRDIYESSPAGRAIFDEADHILRFPISQLCFAGPEKELEDTINAQPAILTVSVAGLQALYERLEAAGTRLEPLYVAGHSLGEYAALVAADGPDFPHSLLP